MKFAILLWIKNYTIKNYIYSYRIRHSMDILESNSSKNQNLIYKGIVCAIDIHRKAMQFVSIFYNMLFKK